MKKQLKLNNLNSNELSKQKMSFVKGGQAGACERRCKQRGDNVAAAVSGVFWA